MNPEGRQACRACGSALSVSRSSDLRRRDAAPLQAVSLCPRCAYQGMGITYFSRNRHVAGLVGAAVLTAGMMGAGGFVYYLLRRNHLICPRCGAGWGADGERAAMAAAADRPGRLEVPDPGRERAKSAGSFLMFLAAAALLVGGIVESEAAMIVLATFAAAAGAALQLWSRQDRDRRRAALISSLQLPVLKLAADSGGRLTVTQVAAELGWPLHRAEKILQSLDDGLRVDSEVTDEGVIVYEFRELLGLSDGGGEMDLLATD